MTTEVTWSTLYIALAPISEEKIPIPNSFIFELVSDAQLSKFKADPYNSSNFLIQENDILNIMNSLNIQDFKINNLSFYQQAFTHKSYTQLKDYEE